MELTKEISYDKDLIQNDTITLKYSGELFKNNSEEVFIVYGYDKDWKNTTHQKMEKQDDCFSANIQIQAFDEFNFCFRNSLNVWDNNNYSDYHLPISNENIEFNSELNELLDTILNQVKSPVQPEVEEKEDFEKTVAYFEDLFDELFDSKKTSIQNTVVEENKQQVSYYEDMFDELYVNSTSTQESNNNLDLEEILPKELNASAIQIDENNETENNSSLSLITTSKKKSIFDFENLSPLYVLKKRIRLAFYKLIYVLPEFLFGEEDDSKN